MADMDVGRIVLLGLTGMGAAIDVRTRRIPNAVTFGGAAAAFVYHGALGGLAGLGLSAAGWALGIALFLPMFLLRGMGAGDVKLLGAVGAWLGPVGVLWSALFSVFAGGLLALVVGAWHGYLGQAFRNLWVLLGFWRSTGIRPVSGLTLDEAPGPRLAYGLAIFVGTVVAVLSNY
jgi:prepilin peptidase CpaA